MPRRHQHSVEIEESLIFLCTGERAYAVLAEVVSPSTPLLA